jgi:hypothetical protein
LKLQRVLAVIEAAATIRAAFDGAPHCGKPQTEGEEAAWEAAAGWEPAPRFVAAREETNGQ